MGSSPGWWAATVATYCPSRPGNYPNSYLRNLANNERLRSVLEFWNQALRCVGHQRTNNPTTKRCLPYTGRDPASPPLLPSPSVESTSPSVESPSPSSSTVTACVSLLWTQASDRLNEISHQCKYKRIKWHQIVQVMDKCLKKLFYSSLFATPPRSCMRETRP